MKLKYSGVSLQNRRPSNMDCLLLKDRSIDGNSALISVVCDGVGSLEDGLFASSTAVKMLGSWFDTITNTDRIGIKMRDTVADINSHIITEAKHANINTASTLSALLLIKDFFYISHIGDSRIYCYDGKILTLITNDDVSASGKLSACIGQNKNIVIQCYEGLAIAKSFIVCSDGLYKRMNMDFMISKIKISNKRSLKESVKALTRYVMERGEQDNISIALITVQ